MEGVNLTVSALGAQGDGLAVDERGARWVVPGALPGDVVTVERSREKNGLFFAETCSRSRASPERVPSYCAIEKCGGCVLREFSGGPAWKQAEAARVLGFSVAPIVSDARLGYRHRTRLHRVKGRTGFFAAGSHHVVAFDTCKVLLPELDARVQQLIRALAKLEIEGEIEAVYSPDDRRFAIEIVGAADRKAVRSLVSSGVVNGAIVRGKKSSVERHGEPYVLLKHPAQVATKFFLEPGVFSQANVGMNAALVKLVSDAVPSGSRVLELHAGAGNLTLGYATKAANVIATEWDEQAVLCLRRNVEVHAVRAQITAAGDRDALEKHGSDADVLVLDPPRTGAKAVADALAATSHRFARIVYVSCDLQTLARDVKILADRYALAAVTPVDMFFGTPHIEAVACFSPR